MTTSEIFAAAAKAKVKIFAMTQNYGAGFYVNFEAKADGMEIKGSADSEISLDDAVEQAWEKFTSLATEAKLLAPQLEYQPKEG